MDVKLIDIVSGQEVSGIILPAEKADMPLKKQGWKFSWKQLYGIEGATYYKLCLKENVSEIQGLIMLTLMNQVMLYLNNIEVAPHNYGSGGRYENVAGGLLAYGCLQSFELGKDHYEGFLSFDSKTELIPLYVEKYGATHVMGQKMFFDPDAGRDLMKKYLNRSFIE